MEGLQINVEEDVDWEEGEWWERDPPTSPATREASSSTQSEGSGSSEELSITITTSVDPPAVPQQRWVGPEYGRVLREIGEKEDRVCSICHYHCLTQVQLEDHLRRHFSRMFCRCGYNSESISSVRRHQQAKAKEGRNPQHGGEDAAIYEVDEERYNLWTQYVGLVRPPPFKIHPPQLSVRRRLGPPPRSPPSVVKTTQKEHALTLRRTTAPPLITHSRADRQRGVHAKQHSIPPREKPDPRRLLNLVRGGLGGVKESLRRIHEEEKKASRWLRDLQATVNASLE